MAPRFPILASSSEARNALLQGLVIAAITITGLRVAHEVFLPLAIAILLSFVLTPPLLFLRRWRVPRFIAVAIVVALTFSGIFLVVWLMSLQATQLAADLPRYQQVLAEKISAFRESAVSSPVIEKATEALKDLESEFANPNRNRG
jgi:predicted PurR-regulated permease PerM